MNKTRALHKRRQRWHVPPCPSGPLLARLKWARRYGRPLPAKDYAEAGVLVRTAIENIGPMLAKAFAMVGEGLLNVARHTSGSANIRGILDVRGATPSFLTVDDLEEYRDALNKLEPSVRADIDTTRGQP